MRIAILLAAVLISPQLFSQALPSTPPPTAPPAVKANPAPQASGGEPFTQLEQVIAQDIADKREKLEHEFTDFLEEIRKAHPGFMFSNGSLVPIPKPQADKAKGDAK